MERNCTRHSQSDDNNGASCSTSACLRTALILRKVMEHFSDKELKQYSVVSKQWSYEARSLMRIRGAFIAKLRKPSPVCRQLLQFASDVEQMNVVPFSGMSINIFSHDLSEHQQRRQPTPRPTLDPLYNVLLDRVDWKYFSVSFHQEWMRCSKWNCQAFLLAKRILRDFCGVFEVLEFNPLDSRSKSIEPILQGCTFPRLKTLEIRSSGNSPLDEAQKLFIKTVVARSPKLEQVHLKATAELGENFLEGSSAILLIDSLTDPMTDQICEDLVGALQLKQMKLNGPRRRFRLERLDRIVPQVLQTSRTTLKSLHVNLAYFVKLMCYGICLENVTDLKLFVNLALSLFIPWELLMDFDFTRIFPKLNNVEVYPSNQKFYLSDINQIIDQGNAALTDPSPPDRADSIKLVSLTYLPQLPSFLGSMFPETEILKVRLVKGPTFPYEYIWDDWLWLREFHIQIDKSFFNRLRHIDDDQNLSFENVDSLFCGIYPEEVAELMEQDEEYLKTVNIVPIRPAITCITMCALHTLKLVLRGSGCFSGKNDPTFIFSKVTGFVAFARCPNLTVTIETHLEWENAVSHMKSFATLVYH